MEHTTGWTGTSRRPEDSRDLMRRETETPGRELGPFELLRRTTQEMDRMFGEFGLAGFGGRAGMRWPALEMFDRDDQRIIRVEMPGMKREDVRLRVVDDTLVIEGERKVEGETGGQGVRRSEWTYGRFAREILLPPDLDANQVRATMKDGVLEIAIPFHKERRAREREVEIRSDDAPTGRVRH